MKQTDRTPHQNYQLVRSRILAELNEAKLDHLNSFAPTPKYLTRYDNGEPSVQVVNKDSNISIIYDIEVTDDFTPATLQKWLRHSAQCSQLFIVVDSQISGTVEAICAENLENYEIITYTITTKGRNTVVDLHI
jgi:hypothetical protein